MGEGIKIMTMKRVLFLPDAHTPYHDKRAMRLIVDQIIPRFGWDTICILGDWWDNYSISNHLKTPTREKSWKQESKVGKDLLKKIGSYPFRRRILIKGNHERWLENILSDKAPALYEEVMDKTRDPEGWEVVEYMESTKIGALHITHDLGYSGMQSAQQSLAACGDNTIIGHNHNMTYVVRGNAKGECHVGSSFGWLGDYRRIDYRHRMRARRDWVLGFGYGYLLPSGVVFVVPVPIIKYQAVVEGVLFKG
jgi:metallophosphoesterase superfamily enzyme